MNNSVIAAFISATLPFYYRPFSAVKNSSFFSTFVKA